MTDDDEMEHVVREIVECDAGPLDESDDGIRIEPLCTECVRELPRPGSDLCEFCTVVLDAVGEGTS